MNVNPGNFDKKIQIILPAKYYPDAEGFESETEPQYDEDGFEISPAVASKASSDNVGEDTIIRTCWAQITHQSGKEILESESEFDDAEQRFLVRYTPTVINTNMLVRYAGHDYDIEYVNTYGDNKEYTEIWTKRTERV